MKTTLILSTIFTACLNAQPLDWRDNLVYPTNPPKDAVQRENPEIKQKVIPALKTQSAQESKSPDDQFLEAYKIAQQGLSFSQNSKPDKAREMFLSARELLNGLTKQYPEWQPSVVKYRLDYLQKLLDGLQK